MIHTEKSSRMDITIDDTKKVILIQQRWKYYWQSFPKFTLKWTEAEKKYFHKMVDQYIWGYWGNAVNVKVRGNSTFAKANASKTFHVQFDVKKVETLPHWQVYVTKLIPGTKPWAATVDLATKIIKLYDYNVNIKKFPPLGTSQPTIAHEFGHTLFLDDEYYSEERTEQSKYIYDIKSMMNAGSEFRTRHLDIVITILNLMFDDCEFYY